MTKTSTLTRKNLMNAVAGIEVEEMTVVEVELEVVETAELDETIEAQPFTGFWRGVVCLTGAVAFTAFLLSICAIAQ